MLRLHFTFGVYRDSSIIFFGSGKVAYPSLKILRTHFDNLQVVTYFTAPNQRLNNEVELFCKEANIPFTTPIKEKNNSAVRK